MSLRVIPFAPEYADRFRDLNKVWLEEYFYVEPKDIVLLEDCENTIINKGGYIFFAEYEGSIVGCFSLIKLKESIFELGKMAVDKKYQGLKIGQQLLSFAIDWAKKNNWNKIILYSNTKLDKALYVYRKYGFKEVELEKNLPYARSDIKMELEINKL
ncbi:GNAT family N-acetyltransferase [Maribacter halichondriae]|uniref:GNAT family N-acetyltransferase n=1 Tax=Maribacter halichondriae TaxID=2980554 RepID=UPI0023597D6D|nr:GNAT family N-acetyltransferase [Maribacter sp. Hal144]